MVRIGNMSFMKKILLIVSSIILSAATSLLFNSCEPIATIDYPQWGDKTILNETYPLSAAALNAMEGIYKITGTEEFGDTIVIKHTADNQLSMFSATNGFYAILKLGSLDSVIMMQGNWRYIIADNTGLVEFYIGRDDGAADILNGQPIKDIVINGTWSKGNALPNIPIVLEYIRPFSEAVTNGKFLILGHRAGGRTSDRLPHSENSIEMVKYTAGLGTMGIEIDIQLTKDNIPVIYHDPDINIRLTTKGPIFGKIGNFTFNQLENYVRLIHGEKIPTLEGLLNYVIDSTELRFVWLDMKNDDYDISVKKVQQVMPIQKAAMQKAKAKGRDLLICIGLPGQNIYDAFVAQPTHADYESLCELSVEQAEDAGAKAWTTRWTLGTADANVAHVQAEGMLAFCWTLDDLSFIQDFITNGKFDGILSNYPSIVAYYHYIRP